jgi:DNA-binding CsgD family transcriptional regulator
LVIGGSIVPGRTTRTPFIGRQRELAALMERLRAAGRGDGSVVLISGEPGVGKTRLLAELVERSRSEGWRALAGRAYETEGLPPYVPFIEALTAFVRAAADDELRAALGGGAADIALLVPEIAARLPELPALPPRSPEAARYQLFERVAETLVAIARSGGGLLLTLDDVQWADRPSLLLLEHVARRLDAAPLLIAAAYRTTTVDRDHPLTATLAALSREGVAEHVPLAPFTATETAAAVEALAGVTPSEAVVRLIYGQTAGNAFFVGEVAQHLRAEGHDLGAATAAAGWAVPESVRQVIRGRLARLGAETNRLLESAAVLGDGFAADVLGATSGLGPAPLMEAFDEALRAGMLREAGDGYRFGHDLLRQTVYNDLNLHRRQALHLHAAVALEQQPGESRERLAALATHYRLAGTVADPVKVLSFARRAGEAAMAVFAWEEAVGHFRAAVEASERQGALPSQVRCDLLLTLGEAQRLAALITPGAIETFLRALDTARAMGSAEHMARAALGYGEYRLNPHLTRQLAVLEEALTALEEADHPLRARVMGLIAECLVWGTESGPIEPSARERAERLSAAAVAMARRLGDPDTLGYTLNERQHVLWGPAHDGERLTLGEEMVQLAGDDPELALKGCRWRAISFLEQGDAAGFDRELARYAQLAERTHLRTHVWYHALWCTTRAILIGDRDEAVRWSQRALTIREDAPQMAQLHAFALRRAWDSPEDLEQTLAAIRALVDQRVPGVLAHVSVLLCDLGRTEEARAAFEQLAADEFGAVAGGHWGEPAILAMVAETCAALDDGGRAEALYRRLLRYRGRCLLLNLAYICFGAADHYLGLLASAMGRFDEAERCFEAAIAFHTRMIAPPLVARSRRAYAAMLLRRARPADVVRAHRLLDEVVAVYRALGMERWATEAEALRAGLSRTAPTATTLDGLSAREIEVLRLLAAGKSNPEIAEALVISLNTVYRHVAHIFQKIGVANRVEAAAYAHRQGLVE